MGSDTNGPEIAVGSSPPLTQQKMKTQRVNANSVASNPVLVSQKNFVVNVDY